MTALRPTAVRDGGRVVVGLDGSPSSLRALRHGARLAQGLGMQLEVVTVRPPEVDRIEAIASQDLAVEAAFAGSPPEDLTRKVLEGEPVAALLGESEGADYLVLGSRGHGRVAALMLGSVTMACSIRARCAVVVCHSDVGSVRMSGTAEQEVVVGVDGTEASLGALRQGARFAVSLHLPLLAVCARGDGSAPALDAGAVLASASRVVFGDAPPPWFRSAARAGTPEAVLGRASEGARMLVIGYSGGDGPTESRTSVSSRIASQARCPVVLFHATQAMDPDSLRFDRRRGARESSLY